MQETVSNSHNGTKNKLELYVNTDDQQLEKNWKLKIKKCLQVVQSCLLIKIYNTETGHFMIVTKLHTSPPILFTSFSPNSILH